MTKRLLFLIVISIIIIFYFRTKPTIKNNISIISKPQIITSTPITNTVKQTKKEIIPSEQIVSTVGAPTLKVEIINPKSLPSFEQFKRTHPDSKLKTEILSNGQMIPGSMPTLEQFRKEHPEVKITIEKLDNQKMIPTN